MENLINSLSNEPIFWIIIGVLIISFVFSLIKRILIVSLILFILTGGTIIGYPQWIAYKYENKIAQHINNENIEFISKVSKDVIQVLIDNIPYLIEITDDEIEVIERQ